MKLQAKNKNTVIIALCLVVILVAGIVNVAISTDGGDIVTKEVIISPYGSDLAATMYIPRWALETDGRGTLSIRRLR